MELMNKREEKSLIPVVQILVLVFAYLGVAIFGKFLLTLRYFYYIIMMNKYKEGKKYA